MAFQIAMFFLISGAAIMLASTYAYLATSYDGVVYYVLSGVAGYLAYVPYNSLLYERLIAVLQTPCTVSYLMAVMDASGYVGVFTIYLVAEYGNFENHLDVFNSVGQLFGWILLALWIFTSIYFFVFDRNNTPSLNEEDDTTDRQESESDELEEYGEDEWEVTV